MAQESSMARIIPVSSGKGGVGKTTFAINYAINLSRYGRTVLVDLDMGTSSLRNSIDADVNYDLYHFFKKNVPLDQCVTRLGKRLDPQNKLPLFGFIASPRGMIDEITNFHEKYRDLLIEGLNSLKASYVVLDLKAGLDSRVLDFMPYTNTGVLVFTPHLPAAVYTAGEIVKAILFKKLRLIFSRNSPIYKMVSGLDYYKLFNDLLDRIEDTYDQTFSNLDAFVTELEGAIHVQRVVDFIRSSIKDFKIFYVLNRFNGIRESAESVVTPFHTRIHTTVAEGMSMMNLGWVVDDEEINKLNNLRIPAVLDRPQQPIHRDTPDDKLRELRQLYVGLGKSAPPKKAGEKAAPAKVEPKELALDEQLQVLRAMYESESRKSYRENYQYITLRTLYLIRERPVDHFGDIRLGRSHAELLQGILRHDT